MTYSQYGLIQAADYNSFASSINSVWGIGTGNYGYGQSTTLSTVAGGSTVNIASTEWSTAVSRINTIRAHQSGATYSPAAITSGGLITYLSDFSTTVNTIVTNRNVFNANGTDSTSNYDNAAGWYTSAQREVSITFASGDAARYFFNAGGQIRVSFSLTSPDNSKSTDWQSLCTNMGTLVFGANSFAKSGGGGATPSTLNSGIGYYSLTTGYQTLIQQYSNGSAGAYYNANYIQFQAKSNGTVGSNADKGSVVTINANFIDAATDSTYPALYGTPDQIDEVHGTLRMAVTIRYPSTTYLTSTWGTPTVAQVTNNNTGQISAAAAQTRSFVNNYTTSPWNLDTNGNFAVGPGSAYFYIQPQYDFKAWVHMWGAGGGGGYPYPGYYPPGGPGGYTTGLVQFKAGYTYYIRCGEQGYWAAGDGYYPAGWGGRGQQGGSGGGLSAIWVNNDGFGSFIMVAGGGGGGGNSFDFNGSSGIPGGGGGGGGSSGQHSGIWPFGRTPGGGSQTGPGLTNTGGPGAHDGAWNGYNYHGGASHLGGGGGGGYWGGGGGGHNHNWRAPGGGGSGYVNGTHVIGGYTVTSWGGGCCGIGDQFRIPAGHANGYAAGAGAGGYQTTAGNGGRVVIL